ncbi:MAG: phage tail protein [Pseudomonadota bacterium]
MKKIDALRAAIVAANPQLAGDPDRLKLFVDAGRLVSRRSRALGYEWRYTARLFFEAFTGSADAIVVPLLLWLREHQPGLLLNFAKEDDAIQFAADILDDSSADIAVTFELTEAVALVARGDGSGWDVTHLPEPSPDDQLLDPALVDVHVAQIFLDGRQIVP